jgi:predicted DNA-binding transcriptional regulator YafY
MLDRDIEHLRELGIVIERDSSKRPPTYTLRGGTPVLCEDDLRALALIRETFGDRHPQATQVRALLDRLTAQLTDAQRRRYQRRPALRAPVEPAIDYAPYDTLIADLDAAISAGQRLSFFYRAPRQSRPIRHERVEPHEIEFYDRHFYLVAYTPAYRRVFDFRIDRIQHDATFQKLDRLPPGLGHSRAPVAFRYRLAAEVARGGVSQRFAEQRVVETLRFGSGVPAVPCATAPNS